MENQEEASTTGNSSYTRIPSHKLILEDVGVVDRMEQQEEREEEKKETEDKEEELSLELKIYSIMYELKDNVEQLTRDIDIMKQRRDVLDRSDVKMDDGDRGSDGFVVWLRDKVGLFQYYEVLCQHGYDNLSAMECVDMDDLKRCGIDKIGHRKQILNHVKRLGLNKKELSKKYSAMEVAWIVCFIIFAIVVSKGI